MNGQKPEALRLAEHMEISVSHAAAVRDKAAAELRRLHEVNAELLNACQEAMKDYKQADCRDDILFEWTEIMEKAIAKATGEQQ